MITGEHPKILQRAVRITLQNYGVALILTVTFVLLFIPWWLHWYLLYLGGIVYASSVVAPFVDEWRPKARVPVQGKAIFITGCDSGFGYGLAKHLDHLGLHVFAGCLFPDREGAQSLKKSCSERLHVLPLDVTSDESVENALRYVVENKNPNKLFAVVNNAGVNNGGEIIWTSLDIIKSVFEINTFGVIRVTKTFLPLLCKDKGRIVNVASGCGRYTFPNIVTYCMTKHAVVSFSEGLRMEMYEFGVKVITIEPWMYRTAFNDRDIITNYISKSWEESPEEIKELFPENYIEQYKRTSTNLLKLLMSDNPQEVVNCIEEAILAFDPKYSYNPGTILFRLLYWLLCRFPKPIADLLLHDDF